MSPDSMMSGWYCAKRSDPAGQQGPFAWHDLYARAQRGEIGPDDLLWNPQLPEWLPATQIQGLFSGAAPTAPAAQPVWPAQGAAPLAAPLAGRSSRRASVLPWLIPLIALIVVAAGLGSYFGFFYHKDDSAATSSDSTVTTEAKTDTTIKGDLGKSEFRVPDLSKLIQTSTWGEVPADQIAVVLADGATRKDAERVATAIDGSVVGEIEFINLYQIQFPGSGEAGLAAALATAQADKKVELAMVNEQTHGDVEIWGVRQSALNDPAYQGTFGKGYGMIGVDKAWSYIKGSGMHLWGVNVGVVDSGLYTPSGEFEGDVNINYPTQSNGQLTSPTKDKTDKGVTYDDPDGSHGTAVAGIIGADAGNGGQAGIASVLGNKLTLTVVNQYAPPYGNKEVPADPNDPTVVSYPSGKSYAMGGMVAILKQVEAGAKVINCSWGNRADKPSATTAAAYRKFFEKMAAEHPDVLFVCSAGNDGVARNGSERYPSGLALPNMITVGNVMNDGTVASSSNKENNTAGQEFEVTMAAPGDEAVRSVGKDGTVHAGEEEVSPGWWASGGTSMAAPQVSAAAALLLSVNPNLTAGQIKDILTSTARPGPEELGGKTLAVDAAVLEVINQQREKQGFPRVTAEELENGAAVDAVATSIDTEPNTYSLKAILKALPSVEGADVVVTATAGVEISGETSQHIDQAGDVVWDKVHIPGDTATITVTRKDNDASSVITFEKFDVNGIWNGTFTITDIQTQPGAVEALQEQGCDMSFIDALKGQALPCRIDLSVNEAGTGTGTMLIDASSLQTEGGGNVSSSPMNMTVSYAGNTITFTLDSSQISGASTMTGTVSRKGNQLVIKGSLTATDNGFTLTAVWTVAKESQ